MWNWTGISLFVTAKVKLNKQLQVKPVTTLDKHLTYERRN